MKSLPLVLLAALLSLSVAQTPQTEYIAKYSDMAVKEMERTGIPASITLAQGILESNSGQSPLAVKGNNHFGIKCHSDWKGKVMRHDDDAPKECFRVYPQAYDSYRDHSEFLCGSSRYKPLLKLGRTDYKAWAKGLKAAGYATDPAYPDKLIKIIEDYRLYELDTPEIKPIPRPGQKPFETEPEAAQDCFDYSVSRRMQSADGVMFLISVDGETYRSIAKSEGLFLRELLKFNGLKKDAPLERGTIVYLEKHKKK